MPARPSLATKKARPAPLSAGTGEIAQLKITLVQAKPPIWRRVLVPYSITLARLHEVVQVAMGWMDSHLHCFETVVGRFSAPSSFIGSADGDEGDSRKVNLQTVAPAVKAKFMYEYDFGDSWVHRLLLEKLLPASAEPVPRCVAGAGACPPEDCGGVWGYSRLLEILANPKHPEYDEMAEWMGEEAWDAAFFDLEATNKILTKLRV